MMSDVACSSCECKEGSYETICNDSAVSTALSYCSRDDDHPAVLTLSEPRFDVDNNCNDVSFRSSKPFEYHDHNSTIIPIADNVRATKKRDIIAVHSHSDPLTSHRVDMVILNTVTSIDLTPRSALIADDVTTAVTASTAAAQMISAASCHSAATAIRDRESILIDDEKIEVGGSCYDDPTANDKSSRRASITQKRSSDTAGTGTHISPSRSSSSSARSSSYSSYRMTSMSCCSSDLNCDNDDVDDAPPCRRTIHRSHKFNNKHASKVSNKLWRRRQRSGRDERYIIPAMRDKMRCNSNDEYNTSLSRKKTRDGRDCVRSTATAERGDHRMFSDLILSWWERDGDCKDAKVAHVDKIDSFCSEDRERLILLTSLWRQDTVLEPNMFPYCTPPGVEHYTLWSIHDLTKQEIIAFVDAWLLRHLPVVRRWQYDDNSGERSVDLFHVHVFIEMIPYSFSPPTEEIYTPPHVQS